jgi:hypothetical protein
MLVSKHPLRKGKTLAFPNGRGAKLYFATVPNKVESIERPHFGDRIAGMNVTLKASDKPWFIAVDMPALAGSVKFTVLILAHEFYSWA